MAYNILVLENGFNIVHGLPTNLCVIRFYA